MAPPTCPVIICHHTGRSLLEHCLASVKTSQGVIPRIIVVTSDPTYANENVELLYLKDGPAAKRNLAMQYVQEPYAVFLDDDVEISSFCLYEFWRFLKERPKCGMAFGKIYKMEEGRRDEFDAAGSWITWTGFLWDRAGNSQVDRGQFSSPQRCLSSKSATCAVNRAAFLSVAGFDPAYFILGEESDLSWRMWLRGLEVWYCPTAVSWHAFDCPSLKPKQEFYVDERIFYRGCANYLQLLCTNLGISRLSWMLPINFFGWTLASLGFALRGEWRRASLIAHGMASLIRNRKAISLKRSRVQASRQISDRYIWLYIAYNPPISYYWQRMWRYWTTQLHG